MSIEEGFNPTGNPGEYSKITPLTEKGPKYQRDEYILGETVSFNDEKGVLQSGVFKGFNEKGNLLVHTDENVEKEVGSFSYRTDTEVTLGQVEDKYMPKD